MKTLFLALEGLTAPAFRAALDRGALPALDLERWLPLFTEAGGIAPGNDVKVSGVKVGTVSDVALREGKALVTFMVNGKVRLGSDTTAHIRTGTLLGQRLLTLESDGTGTLRSADVIPVSRTGAPYSLTDAVSEFTANTRDTDTGALNKSLDTLSVTIDRLAPQLAPTFEGLSRISRALNERNESLSGLLKSASEVTAVLGQRNSTAYAASKGAQLSFTKSLALECADYGIRVNAILPSNVDTPLMHKWASSLADPQAALQRIAALQPIGRMADVEEMGRVCLFLATEDSSFITGQGLHVDGGASLDY
jgi:NAD(P)-dependent dehydrogenase (short-subunit alcohol dehydrogenase family)